MGKSIKNRIIIALVFCLAIFASIGVLLFINNNVFANGIESVELAYGDSITVKSDGGSFWIAFNKNDEGLTENDMGHISYMLSNLNVKGENASVYAFQTVGEPNSTPTELQAFEDEGLNQIKVQDKIGTVFAFKPFSNVEFLARSGVVSYLQMNWGIFDDQANSYYGVYIKDADVEFDLVFLSVFTRSLKIYYEGNITVEKANAVTPDSVVGDAKYAYIIDNGVKDSTLCNPVYNENICLIPFSENESGVETTIGKFDGLYVNGQKVNCSHVVDGSFHYIACHLKNGDSAEIKYTEEYVKFNDQVEVLDLIDIADKDQIVFNTVKNSGMGIGSMPNRINTAIKFNFKTPTANIWSSPNRIMFLILANNCGIWSNLGYMATFCENTVSICTGLEKTLALKGNISEVKHNSEFEVEFGVRKGYNTNDVYTFNRVYVKVNGKTVIYYDDFERMTIGSTVCGPYLMEEGLACSISTTKDVAKITCNTEKSDKISVGYKSFVEKNGNAEISFVEKAGYKLSSLKVNGQEKVDSCVVKDSKKVFTLSNVSADTTFTYAVEQANVNVSVNASSGITAVYNQTEKYADNVQIKLELKNGKALSSVKVNGKEKISDIVYGKGCAILTLVSVKEDISVVAEAESKSYTVSYEQNANATVSVINGTVSAGGSAVFTVTPNNGYKIEKVLVNGKSVNANNGVYTITDIYANCNIVVTVIAVE